MLHIRQIKLQQVQRFSTGRNQYNNVAKIFVTYCAMSSSFTTMYGIGSGKSIQTSIKAGIVSPFLLPLKITFHLFDCFFSIYDR
jgi:hypothetical protein